eukprot:gb/GEZJ01007920.1/.p1 GENE.gb/GEZJ01007920.1/~~gb/GEZJ01007920.1/.p1  ORF type:complete len:132 (+),score=7.54 gb/GEZJ01007920.1/:143-538(+)
MAKHNLLPRLPLSLRDPPLRITCSGCHTTKLRPAPHPRTQHNTHQGKRISPDVLEPVTPPYRITKKKYTQRPDTSSYTCYLQERKSSPPSSTQQSTSKQGQKATPTHTNATTQDNIHPRRRTNSSPIVASY